MGNFYVNFSVKHGDPRRVADALKRAGRKAYVSPAVGGYVVAYEEESDWQNPEAIEQVGTLLSREADAPVLAVLNHDDDILCYWLFADGQFVDSYNSDPAYFGEDEGDEAETGGDVRLLCETLADPSVAEKVDAILRGDFAFAVELHEELVRALGLPDCAVGFGYQYLHRGEVPDGLSSDQLIHTID